MKIIEKNKFKVLLLYPNLSMLFSPPLSMAIFTTILKKQGYIVDIFDVTPYVGEGATAMEEKESVSDEMNSLRAKLDDEQDITFQVKSTEENMTEMMQSRAFSFEEDLGVKSKTGLRLATLQASKQFELYTGLKFPLGD